MYALYRITGRKFLRPDEWRDWYQGAHPSEKSLPGR